MGDSTRCEFTGLECDKGKIYDDDSVGCGFYDADRGKCSWLDDLPQGMPPRMFYNDRIIELKDEFK